MFASQNQQQPFNKLLHIEFLSYAGRCNALDLQICVIVPTIDVGLCGGEGQGGIDVFAILVDLIGEVLAGVFFSEVGGDFLDLMVMVLHSNSFLRLCRSQLIS